MKKSKNISYFAVGIFFFVFFINLVNAGLVVTPEVIDINKTFNQDKDINIQIKNTEAFSFYNVSFKENPHIFINKISEIPQGSMVNVTAKVTSNENILFNAELIGFFITNVGEQNKVHKVNVTSFKSTPCDLSITKGDSVEWYNSLYSEIMMMDNTNKMPVDGGVIPSNNVFTKAFPTPMSFPIYFTLSGFKFPEICIISVLESSGLVNDPQKNGKLSLNVFNLFNPTSITAVASKSDYNVKFFEKKEGVITIKNTGNQTAKNILLSGDWFTFDKNNFDILVNEEMPVIYTLNPKIFSTAETNKTHNKTIEISGNFDKKVLNFDVFIQHAFINENMTGMNTSTLIDILCSERPDLCEPQVRIIYREGFGNDSSEVTVTQEGFDAQQLALLEQAERFKVLESFVKETISNQTDSIKQDTLDSKQRIQNMENVITNMDAKFSEMTLNGIVLILVVVIFGSVVILSFILIRKWRKNKQKEFEKY